MGVKVREWKGAWWLFVNHEGQRKAKRVGTGEAGKRAALDAAAKIQAKLTSESSWATPGCEPLHKPRVASALGKGWTSGATVPYLAPYLRQPAHHARRKSHLHQGAARPLVDPSDGRPVWTFDSGHASRGN